MTTEFKVWRCIISVFILLEVIFSLLILMERVLSIPSLSSKEFLHIVLTLELNIFGQGIKFLESTAAMILVVYLCRN